jgi:hypothetical protein
VAALSESRALIVEREGTIRNVEPTHRLCDTWIEIARMTRVEIIRPKESSDVQTFVRF